jgi:nicotinamidase-related amidase
MSSMKRDDETEPDFASAALVTIDTQRDTLDGQPFEIAGTTAVLPAMSALLGAFRGQNAPIVHIVRIYKRDGSNVDPCRRRAILDGAPLLIEGSPGCELAPALCLTPDVRLDSEALLSGQVQSVGSNEVIIYKPRWGAFFKTPLEAHLDEARVNTIVFAGCNFPNCPRTSIYEASERDFRIVLAEDAVSGFYEQGRRELTKIGVRVMSSADAIARLESTLSAGRRLASETA